MTEPKLFVFKFGEFEVREREFLLIKSGEAASVEPKAFRVLLFLLRNPGRLIPKDEILNAVWSDTAVSDNSLTRSIATLRRLLGDDSREPRYIATVQTVGYRFLCEVEVREDSAASGKASGEPEATGKSIELSEVESKAGSRKEIRGWVLTCCVVLALCAGAFVWYLHSSLPALRVTGIHQITNDRHGGWIGGIGGAAIYFNSNTSSPEVYFVSALGGEIQKVPLGSGHAWLWDVSPDGSNLLVRSLEPSALWTVGIPGGPAHLITKDEGTWNQRFSPDGKYIAYSDGRKGQEGLYVMGRDGADVHIITTMKATDDVSDLAWSPDGGRIRFTKNQSLWEVSSTGANLRPVFPKWKGPAGQCCGQWTPDGAFYLFLAGGPVVGGFEQIWALDERHRFLSPASADPVQLTSGPIHWVRPTPSKDGKKIFATGKMSRDELVRVDRTSKQPRGFLGGLSAEFLTYSKDGAQIAYVTYPDGILWRAKADGTEKIQLTNPPLYPVLCRWSPDGSQILFTAQRDPSDQPDPSRSALYVIPTEGGSPRLLVSGGDGQYPDDGVWSPDGRRVLYNIHPKDSLQILDLVSGKVSEVPGSNGLFSPRWSPDGRYLAAMPRSTDTIRLFDLQAQQWSTLVEHLEGWAWPTWSHDSKFLYAVNTPAVNPAVSPSVYRIALHGGTPQRVVDLKDFRFTGSIGGWFGLDPDDTPLLLRDNGTDDIYALTLDSK